MEKIVTKKVVMAEVRLTLSLEETLCLANALNHLYSYTQGGVSLTTEQLREAFNELSKELNQV